MYCSGVWTILDRIRFVCKFLILISSLLRSSEGLGKFVSRLISEVFFTSPHIQCHWERYENKPNGHCEWIKSLKAECYHWFLSVTQWQLLHHRKNLSHRVYSVTVREKIFAFVEQTSPDKTWVEVNKVQTFRAEWRRGRQRSISQRGLEVTRKKRTDVQAQTRKPSGRDER